MTMQNRRRSRSREGTQPRGTTSKLPYYLLEGEKRFRELSRLLDGISARTFTKQLCELESDGSIHRKVFHQVPPKVEYSLTPIGKKFERVLVAMHDWGITLERARTGKPRKR